MDQKQMFYAAHRKIADTNILFLEMVKDGLTRAELEAAIAKRPELWERFAGFLPKLP